MEERHRTIDTRLLMEHYRELLPQVERLPLVVTGSSMTPFLVHKRDTVYLSKIDRPLRVGDMVLYQRDNGAYILHRICKVEGEDRYTIIGDAHWVKEPGVRRDQMMALVTSIKRKGRTEQPGTFWWEFFRVVWVRIIPLRKPLIRGWGALRELFRRKDHESI